MRRGVGEAVEDAGPAGPLERVLDQVDAAGGGAEGEERGGEGGTVTWMTSQ